MQRAQAAGPCRAVFAPKLTLRAPRIGRTLRSWAKHSWPESLKGSSQPWISSLSASICNVPATARLLEGVPEANVLRGKLAEPLLFQHWDAPTQRAIWIASNGVRIRCVTVSGLCELEIAGMWVSFTERITRARFNLSPQLVRDVIEAEMDVAVALVN
jgi:hypothetical protein